jgi:hypothetical protein
MCRHYRLPLLILVAALLLLPGCDFGFSYHPVDANERKAERWDETIDGVQFGMASFADIRGGLLVQGLEITNNSDFDVAVVSAKVEKSDGKSLEAEFPRSPEDKRGRWDVPKGRSARVSARWNFQPKEPDEALGRKITWVWNVRIGENEHVVRVKMEQE